MNHQKYLMDSSQKHKQIADLSRHGRPKQMDKASFGEVLLVEKYIQRK